MLSNFFRAKLSTHSLMVAAAVLAFAAHQFFSDPQAAAWLRAHWVARDLYETAGATLIAFGIYKSPTKPMI
jgi:hypothetical protein